MGVSLTTEQFVKRAKRQHGNKYDYSRVSYKKAKTKVEIVCKKHGPFLQTPDSHLSGRGCRKCGFAATAKKTDLDPRSVSAPGAAPPKATVSTAVNLGELFRSRGRTSADATG